MKVLHFNDNYDRVGGAERYFYGVCEELEKRGVITYKVGFSKKTMKIGKRDFTLKSPLRSKIWPFLSYFSPPIYEGFKNILEKVKPDIVHIHNNYLSSISILKPCVDIKIPIVQTVHDFMMVCPSGWAVRKKNYALCPNLYCDLPCVRSGCLSLSHYTFIRPRWNLREKYLQKISLFLTPSSELKKELEKKYGNVKLLRNFIYLDKYPFVDYKKYQKNMLLYIGALEEGKGVKQLIYALKRVVKEEPQTKLKIIGDGPQRKSLEFVAKKLELDKNVDFLGFRPDVSPYLKNTHCLILPSIWKECSPFVFYEGMASGKYLLGSDRGGTRELIEASGCGEIFDPLNIENFSGKILDVLGKNKNQLTKAAKLGREFVEKNANPKSHINKLVSFYYELVE